MINQATTSSNSNNSEIISSDCKVCSSPAHGIHFGITACRACAAFFRRTIVMKREKKYRCRNDDNKCRISNEERYQCRSCRFQKCLISGMTSEKVQYNRDPIQNTKSKKNNDSPSEVSNEIDEGEDYFGIIREPKPVMDLTIVIKELRSILDSFDPSLTNPELNNMNLLERMEVGLNDYRKEQLPEEKLNLLLNVPARIMLKMFESQMFTVAKWLNYSAEFRRLSSSIKFKFFKIVWNVWRRFERYEMSVRMFGQRSIDDKLFTITPAHLVIGGNMHIDFSEVSNLPNDRVKNMFHNSIMKLFDTITKPIFDLKLNTIEVAYMLTETSWQLAGKKLQGDVLELSDTVRDEIANNLHSYYQNQLSQSNYAARLVRLMSIVNRVIKIHSERRNMMELARIFDVFKYDFSDPDMFDC